MTLGDFILVAMIILLSSLITATFIVGGLEYIINKMNKGGTDDTNNDI